MRWCSLLTVFLATALPTLMPGTSSAQETDSDQTDMAHLTCTRTGDEVAVAELAERLATCDVVFLGEQHDNDSGHEFQLAVIQALVDRGHQVVVSMEQFERDVQGVVNDYLAGRIDEGAFLEHARPWGNYAEHYRPIVELARERGLPILAGNIPRRLAASISRGESRDPMDRTFLPRQTAAPEDSYWIRFRQTMAGHMGADGETRMKQFYQSQCLKDDAMAEAITDYLAENPHESKIVVHLCGHFHSDYGLGTVARVLARRRLSQVCVITMESLGGDETPPTHELRNRAHYVFWTTKNASEQSASDTPSENESKDASPEPGRDDVTDDDQS